MNTFALSRTDITCRSTISDIDGHNYAMNTLVGHRVLCNVIALHDGYVLRLIKMILRLRKELKFISTFTNCFFGRCFSK